MKSKEKSQNLIYKNLTDEELQEWFSEATFKTKPFKHQLASIAYAIGENRSDVMFIHGIGTGKTLAALYLLQSWNITGKTLVISPNSVIKTWQDEIEKHTDFTYIILSGSKEDRIKSLEENDADIWIINYEGLKLIGATHSNSMKHKNKYFPNEDLIKEYGFECIIADESHRFKDPFATQTRIAYYFSKWSRYTILMTGTPIGRSVIDMFGQFLVLDCGKTFGTHYKYFLTHYFFKYLRTDFTWTPKRLCNVCGNLYTKKHEHLKMHSMNFKQYREKYGKEKTSEDLIIDIVGNNSIRYARDECLDLPERVYEIRKVEMTTKQQAMTIKVIAGLNIEEIKSNIEYHLHKVVQITSGFLIKKVQRGDNIYEFETNPKLNELDSIINEIGDNKFIIYHQYLHEGVIIRELLEKKEIGCAMASGIIKDSAQEIERFMTDKNCKCLIAHPKSGGEGLNLQMANIMVFYSNGFIGNILREQSEGRIYRAGQKNNCLYIDIVMGNSIDSVLYNSLKNREEYVQNVLDFLKNQQKN